jgi:hypothetical protein
MLAAIIRMQNYAKIADRPSMLRINKCDVAQPRIVRLTESGGRIANLPLSRPAGIFWGEDSLPSLRSYLRPVGTVWRLAKWKRGEDEQCEIGGHLRTSVEGRL